MPAQSRLRLIFSPDWNSKKRRGTSQNQGRYPNITYPSHHIFLRFRWLKTFFSLKQTIMKSQTNKPWAKRTIQTKWEAMWSKRGNTLVENKCEVIYENCWKHYVVFNEWNQGKCTNKSKTRCRFAPEEQETETSRPTPWRSVNCNRLTIQKLQSKRRPHNS